jgi:hypothetical protein
MEARIQNAQSLRKKIPAANFFGDVRRERREASKGFCAMEETGIYQSVSENWLGAGAGWAKARLKLNAGRQTARAMIFFIIGLV